MPGYEKIHSWQDPKQVREALVYAAGFGHKGTTSFDVPLSIESWVQAVLNWIFERSSAHAREARILRDQGRSLSHVR